MTCHTFSRWTLARWTFSRSIAACVVAIACTAPTFAQDAFCGPACDFDLQWFAPVDFDYDCNIRRNSCGYFFHFDKLSWAATGERTTIGQRGLTVESEQIFPGTAFSEGTPPPTYTIQNGIQEAPPDAKFGWGERYEFGYQNGGSGWMAGVLDGPRVNSEQIYGFQAITIPNTLPVNTQLNINFQEPISLTLPGIISNGDLTAAFSDGGPGSADLSTSRRGFGSVHVNFETPAGFLRGFRDYWANTDNPLQPGPTIYGPGRVLIVTGGEFTQTAGRITMTITDASIRRGGDGLPDNLDGSLNGTFFAVVADINGDGEIGDDEIVGFGADFDDLHTFNVAFDSLRVHNSTETDGIELMKTHQLSNNHKMAKHQNNYFDIGYGVRFLKLTDAFYWEGNGSVLGRTFADTVAENQIVGPQIQARWSQQRGRWNFGFNGRCLLGYNIQDLSQTAGVGEDLTPGALNRPANAQPTYSSYGAQENDFSPVAELRVEAAYQISSVLAAKLGYNAMFIDNITRASEIVRYRLPDMGIRDGGGEQDIFINGVNAGFEANY